MIEAKTLGSLVGKITDFLTGGHTRCSLKYDES